MAQVNLISTQLADIKDSNIKIGKDSYTGDRCNTVIVGTVGPCAGTAIAESTIIGLGSSAHSSSVVVGNGSNATINSTVIGYASDATSKSVVIGHCSSAANCSVSIGYSSHVGPSAITIGRCSSASGGSIVLGNSSDGGYDNIVIGNNNNLDIENSIVIGKNTEIHGGASANNIAIGNLATVGKESIVISTPPISSCYPWLGSRNMLYIGGGDCAEHDSIVFRIGHCVTQISRDNFMTLIRNAGGTCGLDSININLD